MYHIIGLNILFYAKHSSVTEVNKFYLCIAHINLLENKLTTTHDVSIGIFKRKYRHPGEV